MSSPCRWTDAVMLLRCHWGLLPCALEKGARTVTDEYLESRSGRPGLYHSRGEIHPLSYTARPPILKPFKNKGCIT